MTDYTELEEALPPGWGIADDAALTCPHGHLIELHGTCPEGCVSPLKPERVYTVKITNAPDGDGDYSARVYVDGSEYVSTVFYSKNRDELQKRAEDWVAHHRRHDPDDVETIQL